MLKNLRVFVIILLMTMAIGVSCPKLALCSDINMSKYYDYPMQAIYLEAIEVSDNQIRIILGSLNTGSEKFLFVINGANNPDGIIRLSKPVEPKAYPFTVIINVVGTPQSESVKMTYYPKELYSNSGRTEPGYIIVHSSTIPVHRPDYIYQRPVYSNEDIEYAQNVWGDLKKPGQTDLELAQDICERILKSLDNHRGVPSDMMNGLTPRQQYERAVQGKDRVWCGNIALIYQYACVSLGIETRLVGTGSDLEPTGSIFFKPVEGHLVTEVFSRELQGWVWVDPTSYVLSAYMGKTPINLNQLTNALFTPLESELQITTFDIKSGSRKTEEVSKSSACAAIKNFFRPGVKIDYY